MNIQKRLYKKQDGSMSYFYGLMIVLLFIVLAMFIYRQKMLNIVFTHLDDNLTLSTLSSAVINEEYFGKSNQIILYEDDVYHDKLKNYTSEQLLNAYPSGDIIPYEAIIMLSNYRYDSGTSLDLPVTMMKLETLDIQHRQGTYGNGYRDDKILLRTVNNLLDSTAYNLTNGKKARLTDEAAIGDLSTLSKDRTTINNNFFNDTYLQDYIIGDIDISNFEVYNVYRAQIVKQLTYKSIFLRDINNPSAGFMDFVESFNTIEDIELRQAFAQIYAGGSSIKSHPNYSNWIIEYQNFEEKYNKQLAEYTRLQSLGKFSCWINTKSTSNVPVKKETNVWVDTNSNSNIEDSEVISLAVGDMIPIAGIGVYSHNGTNNSYVYYTPVIIDNKAVFATSGNHSVDLNKVNFTSVYSKIEFDVKLFPDKLDMIYKTTRDTGTKPCLNKLITIEPNIHN